MSDFVLGSRGSALALRQTEVVLTALRAAHPEVRFRIQIVRTTADRHPDAELRQLGIGFFVKELEVALLAGQIDAAVHSMKDLPSTASEGLVIAAITEREDPHDVLVTREGWTLQTLPSGARVGTSSPRRTAALRAVRPDLTVVPIRGNVETRLRKLDSADFDAVCLAAAGLRRLGLSSRMTQVVPFDIMLPAPGQGALGIQVRAGDAAAIALVAVADHPPTRYGVEAERAVLRTLEAGCRVPVGAHAEVEGDRLMLRASVAALDGRRMLRAERIGRVADRETLGADLAEELLAHGAEALADAARAVES